MKQRRPTVTARAKLEAARVARRVILARTAVARAAIDRSIQGVNMADLDGIPVMLAPPRVPAPRKRPTKDPAPRRVVLPRTLPKVRARSTSGKLYDCRYCGKSGHNQRTCGDKQRDAIRAREGAASTDERSTSRP